MIFIQTKKSNPIAHYTPGVLTGNTLYISGQVPTNPETGIMPEGIVDQTGECLKNMERVLSAAGLDRTNVVMCRVYISDSKFWDTANEAYGSFFGDHRPARIIVPTPGLRPGLLVEIEAIAEKHDVEEQK